ncbi:MAG: phosphate/phosphite/phosphonate ABC transporter substrate-binding protein [Kiritimatiellia bacterium]|nr:phosphate/phosphite/phosphonate ABC transporter substrate-binding protein [Kiritimatiellia bacterium]
MNPETSHGNAAVHALLILALSAGLTGCGRQDALVVDLNRVEPEPEPQKETLNQPSPIRIAVGAVLTPEEGHGYYRQFLDYIGDRLHRPAKYIDRKTYSEVNGLLRNNEVDMAFICSRPYVEGRDGFGLELLAAPVVNGKTVYHSYIIVPSDSPATCLADLKEGTFAFCDPLSNTGHLAPTAMLNEIDETPESFFSKFIFTYAHDRTIKFVAQKIVDGGAVDSLIWQWADSIDSKYTSKTKVVAQSRAFGIPPVVVPQSIDPELKKQLRDVLLNAHLDQRGKTILSGMMIDRFVEIDDSAYDSIRRIQHALSPQGDEVEKK